MMSHTSTRRGLLLACGIGAVAPSITELRAQATATLPRATAANVERVIREEMQRRRIPGMQVAVVRRGAIAFLGTYGLANVQDSVPATRRTLFTINSITKAFAGVALMQLVDAGQLELDAPVSRYLDGLPASWQPVTIRQLATNESGIPNIMNNNTGALVGDGEEAAWAAIQKVPMEFAPGDKFSYSQTNWVLIGKIIDKVSGRPFAEFIADRQFRAAGMTRTAQAGFGDSRQVIPGGARGYTFFRPVPGGDLRTTDTLGNVFEEFPPSLRTAAGLSSTAEEMARWIIALQGGRLLRNAASVATLWTAGRLNNGQTAGFSSLLNGYALGWEVADRTPHRAVTAIGGARSALFVYPDDDLAVVVLTNLQGSFPEAFIDTIAGHVFRGAGPARPGS